MAAQENRVDIVKYLLENGARANLATEVLLQVLVYSCHLWQLFVASKSMLACQL